MSVKWKGRVDTCTLHRAWEAYMCILKVPYTPHMCTHDHLRGAMCFMYGFPGGRLQRLITFDAQESVNILRGRAFAPASDRLP